MHIRRCRPAADADEWLRMRCLLWPDADPAELREELPAVGEGPDVAVFVAERPGGRGLAGFAEFGVRPYAEGCSSSPAGYLEAWFVDADVRRTGVGAALVAAGEAWCRARGLSELASDALLDNLVSHRAHAALGFEEVERVVLFRKAL